MRGGGKGVRGGEKRREIKEGEDGQMEELSEGCSSD